MYILRCGDNSLYVGHTQDLQARLWQHQIGEGARHTSERLPIDLVYSERHPSLRDAIERERQLKRWSAQKKAALITKDSAALRRLSRRRRPKRQA